MVGRVPVLFFWQIICPHKGLRSPDDWISVNNKSTIITAFEIVSHAGLLSLLFHPFRGACDWVTSSKVGVEYIFIYFKVWYGTVSLWPCGPTNHAIIEGGIDDPSPVYCVRYRLWIEFPCACLKCEFLEAWSFFLYFCLNTSERETQSFSFR